MTLDRLHFWVRQEIVSRVFVGARPVLCALAVVWRRLLFRTTFVAITGSLGKTTAKECVVACLATRFRTHDLVLPAPYYARHLSGLLSLEAWGGATFDVAMRFLREDPWDRLAQICGQFRSKGQPIGAFVRPSCQSS